MPPVSGVPAVPAAGAMRVVYEVQQHYRYAYAGPATDLRQRLMMVPPDQHGGQRLLSHHVQVDGATGTVQRTGHDPAGNRLWWVYATHVPQAVTFSATFRVERTVPEQHRPVVAAWSAFTRATPLTTPDARLREVARTLGRGIAPSVSLLTARAHEWAAQAITYRTGVTDVHTTAAQALARGAGVCQDYAHLLLCVLRLLHIPARYISGHLLGEGIPHAWVEALVPDPASPGGAHVQALDPTHHRPAGLEYITVATGRDFASVTPTSGTCRAPSPGILTFHKSATLIEVDDAGTSSTSSASTSITGITGTVAPVHWNARPATIAPSGRDRPV